MTWRVITLRGNVVSGGTKVNAINLAQVESAMYLVDGSDKTIYSIPQDRFVDLRRAAIGHAVNPPYIKESN